MSWLDKISFAKKEVMTTESAKASAGLYNETAVNDLVQLITRVPDIDEVLVKAGIPRHRLKVIMYDDEIAQAVETRLDAITGLQLRLEGEATEEQIAFVQEQVSNHLRTLVQGAFQARLYGYSVQEVVYKKTEDNKVGLEFVGEKPMQWFTPKSDGRLFYFKVGHSTTDGVEVDQNFKFLLTRCKPTYENPYGEALLSRLYWPWFFRQNGWKFWGKFLERFGSPLLVGKSTKPQDMVNALLMAHTQAVIGVDRLDDVTAVGPSGNNGAAFDQFEAAVIRRIQKLVLGQTLTSGTDGGSGNRALGQVHNNVRADKLDSDISLVLPTIQKVVTSLCLLNNIPNLRAEYSTETSLEESRALRDKDLYAVGVRFTDTYIQENYGLDSDDFTLVSKEPPTDEEPPIDPKTGKPKVKASLKFSNPGEREFTKDQQMVEDVADEAISKSQFALSEDKIKSAVFAATSPEDLEERLMVLAQTTGLSDLQFSNVMEEALRQAQILGFVHSKV